ncbi:MAG: nucleoside phosphorylase [Bacteroidota bacterium]
MNSITQTRQSATLSSSELILRPSGAIYHLNLFPEQLSDTVIIVGDPDRVKEVSYHFDRMEHEVQTREFITHTGYIGSKRLSVISSGIGTDNIDILLNEMDALHNICFAKRKVKDSLTRMSLVRIGTSGSLQADIPVDSHIYSEYAIGLDGLMQYYPFSESIDCMDLRDEFIRQTQWNILLAKPYAIKASNRLIDLFGNTFRPGITVTASGFYAPQGRYLRINGNNRLQNFLLNKMQWRDRRLTNYEMETSGIYGLSKLMGHSAITICGIIANRVNQTFSSDPEKVTKSLIIKTLEKLTD